MNVASCFAPSSGEVPPFQSSSLWHTLQSSAASSPQAPALIEPGGPALSWSTLLSRVDYLAAQLSNTGLLPSHTVAVMLPEGALGLIAMLAVMRVCACSVMDPTLTAEEVRTDLQSVEAAAILIAPEFTIGKEVAAELGLCTFLAYRGEWLPTSRPLAAPRHTSHFALLLQTSATTGRRKVVPLTWTNLEAMASNVARGLQLTAQDRLLVMARPFHILGSLSSIAQLSVGGTVIVPTGLSAAALPSYLREFRPTWYTAGPTTHRAILQQFSSAEASSLRVVRSGGSTMPESLRQDLTRTFGVPVADVYGLTECGPVCSTGLDAVVPPGSVGRRSGPEVAIAAPGGEMLPPGKQGEIVVRGREVMSGYFNDPEATATAFYGDWFRTGDLGHLDAGGQLFLSGRLKEIINRGGQKIIPNEIDAALSFHPAVLEAVAFATPHRTLGEEVACAVILRDEANASEGQLRDFLRATLAPHKIPRRIHFVTSVPRGATGKPKRRALSDLLSQEPAKKASAPPDFGQARATGQPAPIDQVDVYLLELWCSILQVREVSPDDDFFQRGGDSLAAVTMLAQLETEFELAAPLSAERFIDTPTPAGLMAMLEDAVVPAGKPTTHSIVYPLLSEAEGNRLFLIPAGAGKGLYLRRLARHLRRVCPVSLVIPEERGPFRALYPIEDAARHAVAAIRSAQPCGPYLVGGYCHGGVIAFEAAAQLERQGQTVRLMLFDTPSPLIPASLGFYGAHSRDKLARVRARRSVKPLIAAGRMAARRGHWLVLRHSRSLLQRLWLWPGVQRFVQLSNPSLISFYDPPAIQSEILHFLAASHQHPFRAHSRLGWASKTSGRVTIETVAGDHESIFAESHLPAVSRLIASWL